MRGGMSLSLMVVVVTMMVCFGESAKPSEAECHEERRIGLNACKAVMAGIPPSAECCQRVRVTHIEEEEGGGGGRSADRKSVG